MSSESSTTTDISSEYLVPRLILILSIVYVSILHDTNKNDSSTLEWCGSITCSVSEMWKPCGTKLSCMHV